MAQTRSEDNLKKEEHCGRKRAKGSKKDSETTDWNTVKLRIGLMWMQNKYEKKDNKFEIWILIPIV